ncbi:hypothetical protein [Kitasatospora cheerisanensis]|uniref:Uncharacterized protein n=1 Tax=Kitasatospora cheerisanensis KCTC 2395 TaxID=1348663 RepID=A0A066Z4F5_9ACTN|nr:hypothetical protein [Kitasatospora cheerisanensis]KDN85191.1 hypothetical protein KCH_30100 [Kitasatospora cheerisanensis KCTC 2395]
MADGFRVNTDELEAVVKRLRQIQQNMAQTADKSSHGTALAESDFGANFSHATTLYQAHSRVQLWLKDTINGLNGLINEFGDKTHTANSAYKGQEAENEATMVKYQQELG